MDTSSVSLITPEAAFMTTEILTQLTRPDLPNYYQNAKNVPLIAWKTGTSYGRKDAWSIGYNNNYTIGVWVGNFSGKGVPELTGANIATPLLFNLFNAIDSDNNKDWNKMPEHVDFRYVCSETGKNPNDFCANVVIDYFIPGVSKNEMCDHLLRVKIAEDSSSALPFFSISNRSILFSSASPYIISSLNSLSLRLENSCTLSATVFGLYPFFILSNLS